MLYNVTRSILFCHIDPLESITYLARIPGGVKILGPSWAVAAVGKGRYWVISNRLRFPAEVVQGKGQMDLGMILASCRSRILDPSNVGHKRGFIFGNGKISWANFTEGNRIGKTY